MHAVISSQMVRRCQQARHAAAQGVAADPEADDEIEDEAVRPAGQGADRVGEQRHHTGEAGEAGARACLAEKTPPTAGTCSAISAI